MVRAAQSNPIILLQEYCAINGMTPHYKLISVEGTSTFTYRVQVNEIIAITTAQCKKKAKHAAAEAVLERLLLDDGDYEKDFASNHVTVNVESLSYIINYQNTVKAAQNNPISFLEELGANCGVIPDYKLMSVEGAAHAPRFTYQVQVDEIVATGTGQSKKKAKHASAKAFIERILLDDSGGFGVGSMPIHAKSLTNIISFSRNVTPGGTNTSLQADSVQPPREEPQTSPRRLVILSSSNVVTTCIEVHVRCRCFLPEKGSCKKKN